LYRIFDEISITFFDEISITFFDEISIPFFDEISITFFGEISITFFDEISITFFDEISIAFFMQKMQRKWERSHLTSLKMITRVCLILQIFLKFGLEMQQLMQKNLITTITIVCPKAKRWQKNIDPQLSPFSN
jgi:hypothetical protein